MESETQGNVGCIAFFIYLLQLLKLKRAVVMLFTIILLHHAYVMATSVLVLFIIFGGLL